MALVIQVQYEYNTDLQSWIHAWGGPVSIKNCEGLININFLGTSNTIKPVSTIISNFLKNY